MNKEFIAEMLKKYCKHLNNVVESIEKCVSDYDRQIDSLKNLDQKKYGWRVIELEKKKTEAFIKLGNVCPNIEKMNEQIELLQK